MRDMTHEFFCPVCQENNWSHFFGNINLIDSATSSRSGKVINAEVKTLSLGQFRSGGTGAVGEKIEIRWLADGKEITNLRDKLQVSFEPQQPLESFEVEVRFVTPEIRTETIKDHKQLRI